MLALDRMAIEEEGTDPVRLARSIHRQLGALPGAVPIHEIARALDIMQIRAEPLTNFEGALVTTAERTTGAILVNANASPRRQRFTIAHELAHFLNPSHESSDANGFWCSDEDLRQRPLPGLDRHRRQESEANTFAIELVAPEHHFARVCSRVPDLEHVVDIATRLELSREAMARRYVALHNKRVAALFIKDGRLRYSTWNEAFPRLNLKTGNALPLLPIQRMTDPISSVVAADPADWLERPDGFELAAQVLHQQSGYGIVLLHVDDREDADNSDDLSERLTRFPRR